MSDINGHLNGLICETMNLKLKRTSNKYHVMQNPSALIHSHDIITLPDEAEGRWFLRVSMGDVTLPTKEKSIYHFTPLAQCTVEDLVLILTIFATTSSRLS